MNDRRFVDWKVAEEAAEAVLPLVGRLYREHGIVVSLHGERLVHRSPVEIIQAHRRGHRRFGHDVALEDTADVCRWILDLGLAPAAIDVGALISEHAGSEGSTLEQSVRERLSGMPRRGADPLPEGRDVVLYGFGRIGRILARLLVTRTGGGEKYNLRAIVVRKRAEDDLQRRANLLRRDSIHGGFEGIVRVDTEDNALVINGTKVRLLYSNAPNEMDYTKYGIQDAVVIDNSGKWRDRDGLSLHLAAPGVSKVILTAPGQGDVPNIVFGVNDSELGAEEACISAASCTTNAIVPVLKSLIDRYGIRRGHIETVHAFTNDQNLIDNYHKKARRGRSAALNMVITTTGAAKAAAKALPELKGKLTASAIRVPTPNVSMAIMQLTLGQEVTREALNAYLYEVATTSELRDQVGWTAMTDTVSTDLVGAAQAGVVDGEATVASGDSVVVYVWYDNEFGYSCQVMRLLGHVSGMVRPSCP